MITFCLKSSESSTESVDDVDDVDDLSTFEMKFYLFESLVYKL